MTLLRQSAEYKGTSDLFMNSYLVPKISSFCVANLRTPRVLPQQCCRIDSGRDSLLLHAIRALNLNILDHNLLRPE